MNPTGTMVVKLGCVGCGASLDISREVDRLACAHCGTQQLVQRDGGIIHLKEVADTLSKVRIGTDKTAAELAIARLTKEQETLVNRRQRSEEEYQVRYATSANKWRVLIEGKQHFIKVVILAAGVIGGILALFLATVLYGAAQRLFGAVYISDVLFLLGLAMATGFALLGYYLIRRIDYCNLDKFREARDQELGALDAHASAMRATLNSQISALTTQIRKNRDIADS